MKNLFTIVLMLIVPFFSSSVSGQWVKKIIDSNTSRPTSLVPGDIDGDGDADIAAAIFGDSEFVWYENDNLDWEKHIIDGNIGGVGVFHADIDGDDLRDLTIAGWGNNIVKWYKNEGGSPITWTPYTIDNGIIGPEFVYVADIDGDNDQDVVVTAYTANEVVWYENAGGMPISWTKHTIDENLGTAIMCYVVDVDGDDTLDVVANGFSDNDVIWYKNENAGQNWIKYTIDGNLAGANEIDITDIDNDGDPDVVATGNNSNRVVWYENLGVEPVSWTKRTIDSNLGGAFAVSVADMDNNGTMDIFATGRSTNIVVCYSNNGGSNINWKKDTIDSGLAMAHEIIAYDIDGDTDQDIVVNQYNSDGGIVWYENRPVGISDQELKSWPVKIYPIPVIDWLSVEIYLPETHIIEISSLNGQIVYSAKMEGSMNRIDLSTMEKGIYFITVRSKEFVTTEKVIKL